MPFPALIPKSVIIVTVASKVDVKPVFVLRILSFFKYILKAKEASAHVVKYSVKYHPDSFFMKFFADLLEVLIGSKPHIYLSIIPCIIAMCIGFKYRRKIYCSYSHFFKVRDEVNDLQYPMLQISVIFKWRTTKAHRIKLIKYFFISPHSLFSPISCLILLLLLS